MSLDLKAVFDEWNRTDTKIIIGKFEPEDARRVLCEVCNNMRVTRNMCHEQPRSYSYPQFKVYVTGVETTSKKWMRD